MNVIKHIIVKDGDKIVEKIGCGMEWKILHTHMVDEYTLGVWVLCGE